MSGQLDGQTFDTKEVKGVFRVPKELRFPACPALFRKDGHIEVIYDTLIYERSHVTNDMMYYVFKGYSVKYKVTS